MKSLVVLVVLNVLSLISAFSNCVEWVQRTDVGSPGKRYGHAMVYDSDRGVIVFYGGEYSEPNSDDVSFFGDTWEYDGNRWKQISFPKGALTPGARSGHAMAYDSAHRQIVLFGGVSQPLPGNFYYLGDTWLYSNDGTNATWIRSQAANPPERAGHSMVFDPASSPPLVVMAGGTGLYFQGSDESRSLQDSWGWNGTSWTAVPILPVRPVTRSAMIFDSLRGVPVMFGGVYNKDHSVVTTTTETVQVTGMAEFTGGWRYIDVPTPTLRQQHAMAYDSHRGKIVLFGGVSETAGVGDDTDEYTFGSGWTAVARGGPGQPGERARHAMVYDSKRKLTVLFGGVGGPGNNRYDDTWELVNKGPGFVEVPQDQTVPSCGEAFFKVSLANDPPHTFQWFHDGQALKNDGRILGADLASLSIQPVNFSDQGSYSCRITSPCGTNFSPGARLTVFNPWALTATNGPAPSATHAMTYQKRRNAVLLFRGVIGPNATPSAETWEYNSGVWYPRNVIGPSPRNNASLVYHADYQVTYLFGGETNVQQFSGETWFWDGSAWTPQKVSGPSPRSGTGVCYDPVAKRIVLHGGWGNPSGSILHDTWEFDGISWTQVSSGLPDVRPGNSQKGYLFFDSARQKRVLIDPLSALADDAGLRIFEWTDGKWVLQSPSPDYSTGLFGRTPGARLGFAAAYDPTLKMVLINNGYSPTGALQQDTWGYDGNSWKLIVAANGPAANAGAAMAYDEQKSEMIYFGGNSATGLSGQTWVLSESDLPRVFLNAYPARITSGQSFRLSTVVGGAPNLQFQWRRDGFILNDTLTRSGTHSASLLLKTTSLSDAGQYDLVIQNDCFTTNTAPVLLEVAAPSTSARLDSLTNLVSWWTADRTATDHQNLQDGSLENGTTYIDGIVGSAFNFDGIDDQVRVPHRPAYNPSGSFSVELWFNANSQQRNPNGLSLLVDKSHGGGLASGWFVQIGPDGRVAFGFGNGDFGDRSSSYPAAFSLLSVLDDTWHHLAGVWDRRQILLYLDGALQQAVDSAVGPAANDRDIFIGRWWGGIVGPSRAFRGWIDEVSFYNGALTGNEVKALFDAGSVGKAAFLSEAQDTDGDSLPDAWETAHQLNPNDPSDTAADPDGDGLSNLQEYRLGTDPRNPSDSFGITNHSLIGANLQIQIRSVPGRTYQLEKSTDLPGTWQETGTPISASEPAVSFVVPLDSENPRAFFRVKLK